MTESKSHDVERNSVSPWACHSTCTQRKPIREPLLYVAMPYRRCTYSQRENIARANAVGRWLAEQGSHVLVPHNTSSELDPFNRLGDEYWLACTANMLAGCTHIVCGPGWEQSAGAVAERALAESLGLTIVTMEAMPS